MSEAATDKDVFWVDPDMRGIFPLDKINLSHSLAKTMRTAPFHIRIDHDFEATINACAQATPERPRTWINEKIKTLYLQLHYMGFAHCVEVYDDENNLVGGLYGMHIGSAFFGESMFHRARDASKIALMHLAARLRYAGFQLLDTQFITPHLASLGAIEIPRADFHSLLDAALGITAAFDAWPKERAMSSTEVINLVRHGHIHPD